MSASSAPAQPLVRAPRISRAAAAPASATAQSAPSAVHDTLRESGQALDASTRGFMEARFGADFGDVRVHADASAARSARSVQALAYTVGPHIAFAPGRYAPQTGPGRRLLAHELAHVVQQRGAPRSLQRSVDPARVHCRPHQHNAVDDPVAALRSTEDIAREMALGTRDRLLAEAARAPSDRTEVFGFYRRRFGDPPAMHGGFRSRYAREARPSREQAQSEEMHEIADRIPALLHFLDSPIHYRCVGVGVPTPIGSCSPAVCRETSRRIDDAYSCADQSGRTIVLCPAFWDAGLWESALILIHELVHMVYHVHHHGTSASGRMRNPECLAGLIGDLYGVGQQSSQCPPVEGIPHPIPTPF
jgi:hypothetical protein